MMLFLVRIDVDLPPDLPEAEAAELIVAERAVGRELRAQGVIHRIWRIPAEKGLHNVGVWRAADAGELRRIIDRLPMAPWIKTEITPLEPHPLEVDR